MTAWLTCCFVCCSYFVPNQSYPQQRQFFFAYSVSIKNEGSETVQLLNRHWIIHNADGQKQEVRYSSILCMSVMLHGLHQMYTAVEQTKQLPARLHLQVVAVSDNSGHTASWVISVQSDCPDACMHMHFASAWAFCCLSSAYVMLA